MKRKLLRFANDHDSFCLIESSYENAHQSRRFVLALGCAERLSIVDEKGGFSALRKFTDEHRDQWIFGHVNYDMKNDVEDVSSNNADIIGFEALHFFVPEVLIMLEGGFIYINSNQAASDIFQSVMNCEVGELDLESTPQGDFKSLPDQSSYLDIVEKLKAEIAVGNIYEISFCRQLQCRMKLDPIRTYEELSKVNPAPFSSLYRSGDNYLICASPERFFKLSGRRMFSQPIKGTVRRSDDLAEDIQLKEKLHSDIKERAENVMIVDLVRNDLSHFAERGSVQVDELFGIYTFPHVHQMISTISADLCRDSHVVDALAACFPMGSMTGAPKLRAMELIEEVEQFKRSLFSGSIGYFSPDGNADFNVVIRSILYNSQSQQVSIPTGSAITAMCDAEKEWEECELKSNALLRCLR